MYLIWSSEPDTRMDFVELGTIVRSRLHNGKKPDMAIIMLDEMTEFSKKYGADGIDNYQNYVNSELRQNMNDDSQIILVNEYNHLAVFNPRSF